MGGSHVALLPALKHVFQNFNLEIPPKMIIESDNLSVTRNEQTLWYQGKL